jgi:hypothetical protein
MIAPRLVEHWRRRHHVQHALKIVSDGIGLPLRFDDMPRRGRRKRAR